MIRFQYKSVAKLTSLFYSNYWSNEVLGTYRKEAPSVFYSNGFMTININVKLPTDYWNLYVLIR